MKKIILLWMVVFLTQPALATEIADSQEDNLPTAPRSAGYVFHNLKEKFAQSKAQVFQLIGSDIEPGTRQTLRWFSPQSPGGFEISIPVIVVNGSHPGPVLCLTAAIHGDELNGIEITRRVIQELNPSEFRGVVVGVPIVNVEGFWRHDRYIGDRRDLNRYFPGRRDGPYSSRVAFALFNDIIRYCDVLVDLHTGTYYRENLPQLRADLTVKQVADISKGFGSLTVLHSIGPSGTLRGAATAVGIPAVVMEVGGPLKLELDKVQTGVESLNTFINYLGMRNHNNHRVEPRPVYYMRKWIRADTGGILINALVLGDKVKSGDILAEIINPLTNDSYQVKSPHEGTILGRAQNQFVSPGYTLFSIGTERSLEQMEAQGIVDKNALIKRSIEQLGIEERKSID